MKLLAQDGGGVYEHIRDSNRLECTPNMITDYDEAIGGSHAYGGGFRTLIAGVPQPRIERGGENLLLQPCESSTEINGENFI